MCTAVMGVFLNYFVIFDVFISVCHIAVGQNDCDPFSQCFLDGAQLNDEVDCTIIPNGNSAPPCYGFNSMLNDCHCNSGGSTLSSTKDSYLCLSDETLFTGTWEDGLYQLECVVMMAERFFMISHYPEINRSSMLYIYAIDFGGRVGDFVINKEELQSYAVHTSLITREGVTFGRFLQVNKLKRKRGRRYGKFTGTFTLSSDGSEVNGYTFVKPKTAILDTRGVQTVTIYPENPLVSNNLHVDVQIGVRWSRWCREIIWFKGKRRLTNTGPLLILKTTDDAGLYTIASPKRFKRGWFVHILVIAASFPKPDNDNGGLSSANPNCKNGGVLENNAANCICPPSFTGPTCGCALSDDGSEIILGDDQTQTLKCDDLPGGNPKCKGFLICYGDNYGCKCSTGWWGNACDRACPKGKYGANCEQHCPNSESDCNRFYGPSTNLIVNGCTL